MDVRLDDRLIHGQVILDWLRYYESGVVLVLLETVDTVLQQVMRSALPARFDLWFSNPEQAVDKLKAGGNTIVLVLAPTVSCISRLAGAGWVPDFINLGALGAKPGRIRVSKQVYLSKQEMEALQSVAQLGARIIIQARYFDTPTEWCAPPQQDR